MCIMEMFSRIVQRVCRDLGCLHACVRVLMGVSYARLVGAVVCEPELDMG